MTPPSNPKRDWLTAQVRKIKAKRTNHGPKGTTFPYFGFRLRRASCLHVPGLPTPVCLDVPSPFQPQTESLAGTQLHGLGGADQVPVTLS